MTTSSPTPTDPIITNLTNLNDTYTVGVGDHVINGNGGNDTITAGAGNSTITVEDGNSTLTVGAGNSIVMAGNGNNTMTVGAGHSVFTAGDGNNTISAGAGNSTVIAGEGTNTIATGAGDSKIAVEGGNNTISTGAGVSTIIAGDGDNIIATGAGDSVITAGDGGNSIATGAGSSTITAGNGQNIIATGAGDNVIIAGDGGNLIATGAGKNQVTSGAGDDTVSTAAGDDLIQAGGGSDIVSSFAGNDVLIYVAADNIDFNDLYDGGADSDTLKLVLTREEWMRPDIQADVANYLAFIAANTGANGEDSSASFTFESFGLTASKMEALAVTVDGVDIDPINDAVTLIDDVIATTENESSASVDVLVNDEVPDLINNLTYSDPTHGSVQFNPAYSSTAVAPSAKFIYTPNAGYYDYLADGESTTDSFTYTVTDATGDESTATVIVKITGTNDTPTIAAYTEITNVEENTLTGSISLVDVAQADIDHNDDHKFVALTNAATTVTDTNSVDIGTIGVSMDTAGHYSLTGAGIENLGVGESATVSFVVQVSDDSGSVNATSIAKTITLTIDGSNDAAVITGSSTASLTETDAILTTSGQLEAIDVDSSNLFVAQSDATGNYAHGLFSITETGAWTYVANSAQDAFVNGETYTDSLTVETADGTTQTITVSILGTNDAAEITGSSTASLTETDVALTAAGQLEATDVDSSTSFVVQGNVAGDKDYGNFSITEAGAWTYVTNSAHDAFVDGETYTDSLTVATADGTTQEITVSILGTNDNTAPVAQDVALVSNVTGNNGFENGFAGWQQQSGPAEGPNGEYIARNYSYSFSIDQSGGLIAGDTNVADISFSGWLDRYGDGDGRGTVFGPSLVSDTFAGMTGDIVSFEYRAYSGADAASIRAQLVNVDSGVITPVFFEQTPTGRTGPVTPIDIPIATGGNYRIEFAVGSFDATDGGLVGARLAIGTAGILRAGLTEGGSQSFEALQFLANATDVDNGAVITLQSVGATSTLGATVSIDAAGNVVYDATDIHDLAAGESRTDTFNFTVQDEFGAVSTAQASIVLNGVNDLPVVREALTSATIEGDDAFDVDLLAGASDVDNGETATLTVTGVSYVVDGGTSSTTAPAGVSLEAHTLTVDPTHTAFESLGADDDKVITVSYDVTDAKGGTVAQTETITIEGSNDTPVITAEDLSGSIFFLPSNNTSEVSPVGAAYLAAGSDLVNTLGGNKGFGENTLGANDDGSSARIDLTGIFGESGINFFGENYTSLYVNNNGNLSLNGSLSSFSPTPINPSEALIAPFWGDVDTRGGTSTSTPGGNSMGSNLVYWDIDETNGVFTATWDDVGYYSQNDSLPNAYQVQLIDQGNGNFNIIYRYENINYSGGGAANASGAARAGYSSGNGIDAYEMPGSGNQTPMSTLDSTLGNTGIEGVYQFDVTDGEVSTPTVAVLTETGIIQFTDTDLSDIHLVSSNGTPIGSVLGALTVIESDGQLTWNYSVPESTVQSELAVGDTRVESFTIMLDDQNGGVITKVINVTLGATTLVGTEGNDTLVGTATSDILTGLAGNDTLTGGAGSDTFFFNPEGENDIITDFGSGDDVIDLSAFTGMGYDNVILNSTQTEDGVNIDLGNGNSVTLVGVSLDSLDAGDFAFG